jgi:ABC-2 type transport system ATP-binding protein
MCTRVAIIREGEIVKIEDIKTLQKDNYKKIRIVADDMDESRFAVDGVTNLERSDGAVNFFYNGDINVIMKIISARTVSDVSIEEPTLEEIFMHYYE